MLYVRVFQHAIENISKNLGTDSTCFLLVKLVNKGSLNNFWLLGACCRCRCSIRSCQTACARLISHSHMIMYAVCFALLSRPCGRTHSCRRGYDVHWVAW